MTVATSCPRRRRCWLRRAQDLFPCGLPRTLPCEETAGATEGEGPEGADMRVRELRDQLELGLLQQGEEKYECILKRKQQQVAEVRGRGGESYNQSKPIPSAQQRASP